ncbi:MAG: hypothetical protein ACPGVO_01050 [Spirulinaceae cyanobacterium]
MAESESKVTMNFNAPISESNVIAEIKGDQINHYHRGTSESAVDILQLLQQVELTNNATVAPDDKARVDEAVQKINQDSTLRDRFIGALREGSLEALKEIAKNPYVNVLVAAYGGWREP